MKIIFAAIRNEVHGHYLINQVWKDSYPESIEFVGPSSSCKVADDDFQLLGTFEYRAMISEINASIDED